jgi:hypothetical protein
MSSVKLRFLNNSSLIVIRETQGLIMRRLLEWNIILLLVTSIDHMRLVKVLVHLRLSILRMSTAKFAHVILIHVSFYISGYKSCLLRLLSIS